MSSERCQYVSHSPNSFGEYTELINTLSKRNNDPSVIDNAIKLKKNGINDKYVYQIIESSKRNNDARIISHAITLKKKGTDDKYLKQYALDLVCEAAEHDADTWADNENNTQHKAKGSPKIEWRNRRLPLPK